MSLGTDYCRCIIGAIVCVGGLSGCTEHNRGRAPASEQRAHAILAAARAGDISLFGDLPGTREPGYVMRTSVSLRRHTFADVGADFDPDIDTAGKRLVFASTRHSVQPDLYVKSVEGVAVTQLTSDPAADVEPAFNPDATRVAFASRRSGNWDIWIIGVEGGAPVQVTTGVEDEVHPSWSPDGTKLVFCSLPANGGQWELWIADTVTGSSRQFIGYGLFPEWSPTGDAIVYQRARERGGRRFSIWTLTLLGGEPGYPTEVAANTTQAMILPTWSSDAKRLAYAAAVERRQPRGPSATTSQVFDIWIMDADGNRKARLTDAYTVNHAPTFSPDGRLFFTSSRSGHENIWSLLPMMYPTAAPGQNVLTHIDAGTRTTVRKALHPDNL